MKSSVKLHPCLWDLLPVLLILLAAVGIFSGMFVGCWAMALAEILNLFPVFMRRFNLVNCLAGIILGIAAGKTLGCIWMLLQEAK